MAKLAEFEQYLDHLCEVLRRVERSTGLNLKTAVGSYEFGQIQGRIRAS